MRTPCCLCIPAINVWMPKLIFMKLRMYIMLPETVSKANFVTPSVCLYLYLPIVARQWLGKYVPAATNTLNSRIVGCVFFYTVRFLLKKSLWACLCISNFSICIAEAVVWRLQEPSDSKIWSWVPEDSEPRISVLATVISKFLDLTAYSPIAARQRLDKHRFQQFFCCCVTSLSAGIAQKNTAPLLLVQSLLCW
jgi:hypothetical protein